LWAEYGSHDLPSSTIEAISKSGNVAARQAVTRHFIEIDDLQNARVLADSLDGRAGVALRARLLVKSGHADEGAKLARSILARDTTDCDALIAASEGSLAKRLATNALRLAQQAAAECPGEVAAWNAAARAYMASGLDSGVSRSFQQALDANKQNRVLAEYYTDWLVKEGRHREAIAVGRRLTRYAPALVSGWRLYAELCRELQSDCLEDAERGLADSRTRFGIDLAYGSPPPNGLFGRLVER
jgi:predicted Zn-dependent protease